MTEFAAAIAEQRASADRRRSGLRVLAMLEACFTSLARAERSSRFSVGATVGGAA